MSFGQLQEDNNYYVQGAVNIYNVQQIVGASAYRHWVGNNFGTIVSIPPLIGESHYMTHEMGHLFVLLHTFFAGLQEPYGYIENVVRNPDHSDFNAYGNGDNLVGTNATPVTMQLGIDYNSNCDYIGNALDPVGRPYSEFEPEVKNFMGYSSPCHQLFKPAQVSKMRAFIHLLVYDLPNVTIFELQDPCILYEPYKGEYYLAGPATLNPPLFQYGFDYLFVDTSQAGVYNQPSVCEDTNFWHGSTVQSYSSDYSQPIEHKNHTAINILQLGDHQPRMCYNNYNRTPIAGSVINFTDGVPNGNYTIAPKDSLGINQTTLVEELQPGLYNIQKSYNDGTYQETMILKENN